MEAHNLKIDGTLSGMGTRIYIDGKELHGVRSIKYEVGLNRITTARIELDLALAGEIESDARFSFCSMSESIDNLILNRETGELLKFGDRILDELEKRRKKDANHWFSDKDNKVQSQ